MKPKTVDSLFYPEENLRRKDVPLPAFDATYPKMIQMKHPDLSYLCLEYKEKNPDGYQLAQFYKHYNDFVKEHYGNRKLSTPVERIP